MTLARPRRQRLRWLITMVFAFMLLLALGASASAAQGDNATCLGCHTTPGLSTQLPSGDTLPLTMDPAVYNASVHGATGMQCTACHTNIDGYPHPKLTAKDRRDFQMERYQQCQNLPPGSVQGTRWTATTPARWRPAIGKAPSAPTATARTM